MTVDLILAHPEAQTKVVAVFEEVPLFEEVPQAVDGVMMMGHPPHYKLGQLYSKSLNQLCWMMLLVLVTPLHDKHCLRRRYWRSMNNSERLKSRVS